VHGGGFFNVWPMETLPSQVHASPDDHDIIMAARSPLDSGSRQPSALWMVSRKSKSSVLSGEFGAGGGSDG
jgi:hypothetical protein